MTPDDYCRAAAAPSGSTLYYSLLHQTPAQRQAIIAVHALGRELREVVRDCRDDDVALQTLHWWRMEIARARAGKATHPVCQALQPAIPRFDLPEAQFLCIIEGHEQELRQPTPTSFAELDAWCRRTGGALQQLTAKISGVQRPETLDHALALGSAIQLCHGLRNLHADCRRGKPCVPLDEMTRHGVAQKDFIQARRDDNMQDLLAAQIARADDCFEQALAQLPARDRAAQRHGLIQAAICRAILNKLRKDPCRALAERPSLSPLRKLWIAWRTH